LAPSSFPFIQYATLTYPCTDIFQINTDKKAKKKKKKKNNKPLNGSLPPFPSLPFGSSLYGRYSILITPKSLFIPPRPLPLS